MLAPPSQLVEKYEVLACLEEGRPSAVYQVRHRMLGDLRVVRVLDPSLTEEPARRRRFIREARAMGRLGDAHLARLYDFHIDEDGFSYLEMEHVEGVGFDRLIAGHAPLGPGLALELGRQAFQALGHLHGQELVHGALRPEVLRLGQGGGEGPLVKVVDLGLAGSLEAEVDLEATGVHLGHLRYVAPEQLTAAGGEPAGVAADLYVMAVILYELATGRHPIVGDGPSSLVAGHLFRPPLEFEESDPAGRVPAVARSLLAACLAKSSEERPASARQVAEGLRRAAEGLSVSPRELTACLGDASRISGGARRGSGLGAGRASGEGREEVARAVEEARRAVEGGELDAALGILRRAVERHPGERVLAELLVETEKASRREAVEAARRAEVGERVARVEALLDGGEAEAAGRLLGESMEKLGADPAWGPLRRRLQSGPEPAAGLSEAAALVVRRRRERAEELCRQAEELRDLGRPEAALEQARRALELSPARPIRLLAIDLEAELASARADEEMTAAMASPRREAADRASRTSAEVSQAEEETRERLSEAWLLEARTFCRVEDLQAAEKSACLALEEVPSSVAAESLLISIRGAIAAEVRLGEDELAQEIEGIRKLLAHGRRAAAMTRLGRAIGLFGEHPRLLDLRYRVAQSFLEAELPAEAASTRGSAAAGAASVELAPGPDVADSGPSRPEAQRTLHLSARPRDPAEAAGGDRARVRARRIWWLLASLLLAALLLALVWFLR